jgi:endonuclease G
VHPLLLWIASFACPATLAQRAHYVVCYDTANRAALWTLHEITPGSLQANASIRRSFRKDRALNAPPSSAYTNTGYDRGHLVPARDLPGDQETFLTSNAVPQLPETNTKIWRKIEEQIRRQARTSKSALILTRAAYANCDDPAITVPVPCHLEKLVLFQSPEGETRITHFLSPPARP